MVLIQFACPHCQGVFQVDDAMGGQTVACPHCQGHVQVGAAPETNEPPTGPTSIPPVPATSPEPAAKSRFPEPPSFPGQTISPPATPPPESQPETPTQQTPPPRPGQPTVAESPGDAPTGPKGRSKFEVTCSKCTGTFRSNPDMIGQQVICPYCNARLTVPKEGGPAPVADAQSPATLPPPGPSRGADANRAILVDKPAPEAEQKQAAKSSGHGAKEVVEATAGSARAESGVFRPAEGEEVVDPELAVKDEQTRYVEVGGQMIEIRRLSPEEKAARRFKRNVIMVIFGAIVLVVAMFVLRGM